MHEVGIALEILGSTSASLPPEGGFRARKVLVRVGSLRSVDPETLRFAFRSLRSDHPGCEEAELEIEEVAPELRCGACGHRGPMRDWEVVCPACGGQNVELDGGDELVLQSIEAEAPDDACGDF